MIPDLNNVKSLSEFVFIITDYYFIKYNNEYIVFDKNNIKKTIPDDVLKSTELNKENGYNSIKRLNDDILNHEIKDFSVVKAFNDNPVLENS